MSANKYLTYILNLTIVFLFQLFAFSTITFAQECKKNDEAFMDKVIGSTFRGLARTFVAMTDINKLRDNSITKVEKMSDGKFNKKYAKAYDILKDLPEDIKLQYAITEQMTRQQAIANMKNLNKKEMYKLINAIPNNLIANAFYSNFKQENNVTVKKETMVERVENAWQSMMQRVWSDKKSKG